ncbi:MAG: biotin transporter BioY [Bacteroidetes bacterium]|uniref:Aminopeptidase n=1 Tax=Candidatus Cryptobacteroides avicola TaxID=2840757 RepID=A0A940IID1_9BACT|nr:biotin transporter BioY [Candidatus Cryptobacteroides avicola]
MKKTLSIIAMATAMVFGLEAQEIGNEELVRIRESFARTREDIARMNAVSGNYDLKKLAIDRERQGKTDHLFKYKVQVSGITDQQQSGRCWMFTSMNVLRPSVMEKFNIREFDFSHNYCYFWDMFEKSNLFLENVIRTAERDIILDRDVAWFFQSPVNDGGVWNSFLNIAEKYGVVPASAMPETAHSNRTSYLTGFLNEYLRKEGYALREMISEGASEKKTRKYKLQAMKGVYRILVLCLGEPPAEFTWRYETADGEVKTLTSTPLDFYRSIIPEDYGSDTYIMVMNDPTRPYYQVYEIDNYRNTYEGVNWKYLNLPSDEIKKAAVASIKADEALYASCDISRYYNDDEGIADMDIYDFEALMGMDFEIHDKAARIMTRQSGSAHAMTLIAVDTDENDTPVKWQFENSWGPDAGHNGYFTFTDEWFDEYMFRMVIRKEYLSGKAVEALSGESEMLPAWDYMF